MSNLWIFNRAPFFLYEPFILIPLTNIVFYIRKEVFRHFSVSSLYVNALENSFFVRVEVCKVAHAKNFCYNFMIILYCTYLLYFPCIIKNTKHDFEIYPEMISLGEKVSCKWEFECWNLNGYHSNFERRFRHKSPRFSFIVAHLHHLRLNGAASCCPSARWHADLREDIDGQAHHDRCWSWSAEPRRN